MECKGNSMNLGMDLQLRADDSRIYKYLSI